MDKKRMEEQPKPISLQDIMDKLEVLTAAVLSNKNALTVEEAAAYTGRSVKTLYNMTSNRLIPHYKPNGKMLAFKRDELDDWMLQGRVKTLEEISAEAATHVVEKRRF